jgi:hypothetical protein
MISALRAIRPAHRVIGLGTRDRHLREVRRVLDRSLHGSVTSEKVFTIDDHPRASTADPNALAGSNGGSVRRRGTPMMSALRARKEFAPAPVWWSCWSGREWSSP